MATVFERPRPRPAPLRFLTAAEFAVLPDHLPTGPVKYELHCGKLIVMAPPGDFHAGQQTNVLRHLLRIEDAGGGRAKGEGMIVLGRDPDSLMAPDAYFFTPDQLPNKRSREGYSETIPRIVVEIRSKNDSVREMTDKLATFLAAGVVEAWLVDPFRQLVEIHSVAGVRSFGPSDTVVSLVLPSFAAPVAELIAD